MPLQIHRKLFECLERLPRTTNKNPTCIFFGQIIKCGIQYMLFGAVEYIEVGFARVCQPQWMLRYIEERLRS
ncbi:MAG: hypothetical protein B7Z52_01960 [Burkholderiales bacterium 12-64-5]|nr:MAG: hypothetical protein B7Z52_01960 [Burkholderiales bacterium 12-64-5]